MDLGSKLKIVEKAILSVSEHRDEDSTIRAAALDRIDAIVQREREKISAENEQRVAEMLKAGA